MAGNMGAFIASISDQDDKLRSKPTKASRQEIIDIATERGLSLTE